VKLLLSVWLKLDKVIIEGDSQVVIATLNQLDKSQDWHIFSCINNIIDIIPANLLWTVRKINKSVNFCTYVVAY
jgi:hypothetical protein